MEIIPYIIERELLARRTVTLPFIGTLKRQRIGSAFAIDRSHLTPPRDYLTLAADVEQQGDRFIAMISSEVNISSSEAIESYNRWYSSSIDEMGAFLTIDSVCKIDLMNYIVSEVQPSFEEHLSPLGEEPIAIGRPLRTRGIDSLPIIDPPTLHNVQQDQVTYEETLTSEAQSFPQSSTKNQNFDKQHINDQYPNDQYASDQNTPSNTRASNQQQPHSQYRPESNVEFLTPAEFQQIKQEYQQQYQQEYQPQSEQQLAQEYEQHNQPHNQPHSQQYNQPHSQPYSQQHLQSQPQSSQRQPQQRQPQHRGGRNTKRPALGASNWALTISIILASLAALYLTYHLLTTTNLLPPI